MSTYKHGWVVHHDQDDHPVYTTDFSHDRCHSFWAAVRRYHVFTKGWSDIAYSFGICRHGMRFEGRGWRRNQVAGGEDQKPDDLAYEDSEWYSVLFFIGGPEIPTEAMLDGFTQLRVESVNRGQAGLQVIPHNAFRQKACPGPWTTTWVQNINNTPIEETVALTQDDVQAVAKAVWDHLLATAKDGNVPARAVLGWTKDEIDDPAKLSARTASQVQVSTGGASAEAVADELAQRLQD